MIAHAEPAVVDVALDLAKLRHVSSTVTTESFAPPSTMTVSEWADEHRRLPATAAEPGKFETDRVPYLRRVQDVLGDDITREIVWAKSAQVAGTTAGENLIGYLIDQDPCAVLHVWQTEKALRAWSTKRFDPMLTDSPTLADKLGREHGARSQRREQGDTIASKEFPGGYYQALTARSTSDMRSHSARVAIGEEIDEWDGDIGGQGDPLELLRARSRTYWNGKLYMVSTPTLAGFSRIWRELETSTWEEYWVPCPHAECGTFQTLRWRDGSEDGDDEASGTYRLVWEKDGEGEPVPGSTAYVCEACGALIEERYKPQMLARGEWRPRFPGRAKVGFHINTLYSPLCSWDEIAKGFRRAVKDPSTMKGFVNTFLGLPYAERGKQLSAHVLSDRADAYGRGPETPDAPEVPNGVGLIVAGGDVQGDRIELVTWGFGAHEEAWLLGWDIFEGDPGLEAVWTALDERLKRPWVHASGALVPLSSVAIDANYNSEAVHRFCEARRGRNIFPVIGKGGPGLPLLRAPGPQKFKRSRGELRQSYLVGVDSAKNLIASRLRLNEPGPGYMHFPDWLDPVFYDQLTAERLVTRVVRGRAARVWSLPPGRRNEALDTTCYALAALQKLGAAVIRQAGQYAEQYSAFKPALAATPRPRRPAPPAGGFGGMSVW